MRGSSITLVLILALFGLTPCLQADGAAAANHHFDGIWWERTSADEHSGFINGVADCLTWTAHENGFNGTAEQVASKITQFYRDHPQSADLKVVEVWKKVWDKTPATAASEKTGETWHNPHWYLDGFWWLDSTQEQKQGFLEGYLWCMRSCVSAPSERYSKRVRFYIEKIDTFTRANAGSIADREKVALILRRYRDKTPSSNAQ